jgi:hypothetical protein
MENPTRSIVTRQPQSDPESSLEMTSETLANRRHYGRGRLPLVRSPSGGCSVGFHIIAATFAYSQQCFTDLPEGGGMNRTGFGCSD